MAIHSLETLNAKFGATLEQCTVTAESELELEAPAIALYNEEKANKLIVQWLEFLNTDGNPHTIAFNECPIEFWLTPEVELNIKDIEAMPHESQENYLKLDGEIYLLNDQPTEPSTVFTSKGIYFDRFSAISTYESKYTSCRLNVTMIPAAYSEYTQKNHAR